MNSHPLIYMLQVRVLVYYIWLFKAGHTWISFGDKKNTKKIVNKTSDIVLLAKFKFSEWDQDGMAWNVAEGNKRNMVNVYISESSSEEGPIPYFLVYSPLNISTHVDTHWRKQMENFPVSSLESLLSHTFFCYVIMVTFASIHCWKQFALTSKQEKGLSLKSTEILLVTGDRTVLKAHSSGPAKTAHSSFQLCFALLPTYQTCIQYLLEDSTVISRGGGAPSLSF